MHPSVLIYLSSSTVIICSPIGLIAPSTLKRCRPDGEGTNNLAGAQTEPKNAPWTKWAASKKKLHFYHLFLFGWQELFHFQ